MTRMLECLGEYLKDMEDSYGYDDWDVEMFREECAYHMYNIRERLYELPDEIPTY